MYHLSELSQVVPLFIILTLDFLLIFEGKRVQLEPVVQIDVCDTILELQDSHEFFEISPFDLN